MRLFRDEAGAVCCGGTVEPDRGNVGPTEMSRRQREYRPRAAMIRAGITGGQRLILIRRVMSLLVHIVNTVIGGRRRGLLAKRRDDCSERLHRQDRDQQHERELFHCGRHRSAF